MVVTTTTTEKSYLLLYVKRTIRVPSFFPGCSSFKACSHLEMTSQICRKGQKSVASWTHGSFYFVLCFCQQVAILIVIKDWFELYTVWARQSSTCRQFTAFDCLSNQNIWTREKLQNIWTAWMCQNIPDYSWWSSKLLGNMRLMIWPDT